MLVQLVPVHRSPQRRQLRDLVADDQQLQVVEAARAQLGERLDQPHQVLVRPDVADVEHELVFQLIPLPHALDRLRGGRRREALLDRVVDHDDLFGRNAEEMHDVAFRGLGHGEDAVRLPRGAPHRRPGVHVRRAVRQVLREHQVDAVVDRHDRAAADAGRQHVVRCVIDVRPLAPEHPRHVHLLAQRVVRRRLEHGAARGQHEHDVQVQLNAGARRERIDDAAARCAETLSELLVRIELEWRARATELEAPTATKPAST